MKSIDALVSGHGSIYLVRPVSEAAETWIDDNVQDDAQWFGHSLAVEHRYILDLIDGMQASGLNLAQGY
jgi:hypothetical protein